MSLATFAEHIHHWPISTYYTPNGGLHVVINSPCDCKLIDHLKLLLQWYKDRDLLIPTKETAHLPLDSQVFWFDGKGLMFAEKFGDEVTVSWPFGR